VICLDASVAVKLLLPESDSDQARALVTDTLAAGEQVLVPVLLFSEVTNVLVQHVRRGALSVERGQRHLGELLNLPLTVIYSPDLYTQAIAAAERFGIPSGYDAQYVGLAERTGSVLWTADERLLTILSGKVTWVHKLADYPQPPDEEEQPSTP
jgi:predicted nucleic acid-binding protein